MVSHTKIPQMNSYMEGVHLHLQFEVHLITWQSHQGIWPQMTSPGSDIDFQALKCNNLCVKCSKGLKLSAFQNIMGMTWAFTAEIERKIRTVEMRCFRRLLGISYKDHITNEEVRSRIQKAIGPYKELLSTVKRRKMKWYGHVTRASGLAKTVLQGTVRGGRRRGREKKKTD